MIVFHISLSPCLTSPSHSSLQDLIDVVMRPRAVVEPPPPRLRPPQITLCLLIKLFATGGVLQPSAQFPEPRSGRTARQLARFLLTEIKGRDDVHHPPLSELLVRLGAAVDPGGGDACEWLVLELKVKKV